MRIILIAAFFLLPISAVAAMPLHNVVPDATHHHPVHAKAGLKCIKMQIYTKCPISASMTGA